jgi:L-lactate dehydrogenase complex protein LldG
MVGVMSGRDHILERIRARLAARPRGINERRAAVEAHIKAHHRNPQPHAPLDLVETFRERALKLASTCDRVAREADVPAAIRRYLAEHALPGRAVCWPSLGALDWSSVDVVVEARIACAQDSVGITGAYCAIAETGTLVALSGSGTPGSVSLLPETHIAVLPTARIVAAMEDVWSLLRTEHGALPRAVNFISGPSRTADIEQTVTLGAHGPSRVHIVLVG